MAKRIYQMIHEYVFDNDGYGVKKGDKKIERSSFATLDNAIKNAYFWINKEESWIYTTVVKIEIINKETKNVEWKYEA